MLSARSLVAAGTLLASALAPALPLSASAVGVGTAAPPAEIAHTHAAGAEAERLLAMHNAERARMGLPALRWNASLARDAGGWAHKLLQKGKLHHASADERRGHGENLWMGTAGAWDAAGMVGMFLEERRYFRPAAFPHVSLTGDWSDVGHYTQIVWRDTKEVGCAKQTGNGVDVLVCRYYPAGNVMGRAPF